MKSSKRFGGLTATLVVTVTFAQDFDPMAMADQDRDGKVTLEEYKVFAEGGWGYLTGGADSVKVAELSAGALAAFSHIAPDASGSITHAAFTAAQPERFKQVDSNTDGVLSEDELKASVASSP